MNYILREKVLDVTELAVLTSPGASRKMRKSEGGKA